MAMIAFGISAGAQIPGAPVLQNAWATPGIAAALNFGGGSDGTVYAAAASWAPASARIAISAGAGLRNLTGAGSGGVYGVRIAVPFGGASSTFGFAAFAGIGGGSAKHTTTPVGQCPINVLCTGTTGTGTIDTIVIDSASSTLEIPAGVAIGWRHALGATHGLSVYATPAFVWFGGGTSNGGVFRTALGADFGISSAFGATIGIDFGAKRARGLGGPSGTLYGAGVSYAFGRR